jgi:hypothetical protein
MNHAIEILEKELNTPQRSSNVQDDPDEEDDMVGAIISIRRTLDIKLAIKHLKYMQEASKEINKTNY